MVCHAQLLCTMLQVCQVHAPVLQVLVLLQAHDAVHPSLHTHKACQDCCGVVPTAELQLDTISHLDIAFSAVRFCTSSPAVPAAAAGQCRLASVAESRTAHEETPRGSRCPAQGGTRRGLLSCPNPSFCTLSRGEQDPVCSQPSPQQQQHRTHSCISLLYELTCWSAACAVKVAALCLF